DFHSKSVIVSVKSTICHEPDIYAATKPLLNIDAASSPAVQTDLGIILSSFKSTNFWIASFVSELVVYAPFSSYKSSLPCWYKNDLRRFSVSSITIQYLASVFSNTFSKESINSSHVQMSSSLVGEARPASSNKSALINITPAVRSKAGG